MAAATIRTLRASRSFLTSQGRKRVVNFAPLREFSVSKRADVRYVQYCGSNGGVTHLGAQINEGDIVEISAVDSSIPNSLVKFLASGQDIRDKAKRIIGAGKSVVCAKDVHIIAPLTRPDKVLCVGLNYKSHCDEQCVKYPKAPMFFSKFSSTIIGPYDDIEYPDITNELDWECELAVVIGRKTKCIRPDQAAWHIFGYTVAQDISARDWQIRRNGRQFLLGKSMDTFCPLGPVVVTKSHISNPHDLTIKTWVNGVLKQEANTSEMTFTVDFLVSYVSQVMTLYPGDVILTGTPAGVGLFRKPPEFLKKGDVVETEIQGIGRLRNKVV